MFEVFGVVGLTLVFALVARSLFGGAGFARFTAKGRQYLEDEALVDNLCRAWRNACEGAGVSQTVQSASGPTISVPRITDIQLGSPIVMYIRLLPGQVMSDVKSMSRRLAPHLGAVDMLVEQSNLEILKLTLIDVDPLARQVDLRVDPEYILLGRDELGNDILETPERMSHLALQGTTRSGKSVLLYGILAQLIQRTDVTIAGHDHTGLVFRCFAGTRHARWQVSGLADLFAHERNLEDLVALMDKRIGSIPIRRDTTEISEENPLVFVILEEYPGLLGQLNSKDPKLAKRVRSLVSRILAEGHKAGFRVIMVSQRFEADVVGAFERAMISTRISFRVDNRQSVELLHPGTDPAVADAHTTSVPGIALITRPGHGLVRMRGPLIGGGDEIYPSYVDAIQAA